ncbi:zinc-binding dehydrogenase [Nonomuraea sp. NPDC049028]|uniref:zinc-binding dehydrogenase n=1 Tax=Nonomuraea sp. NPDC049028 TaxID=3364348 RepID=UPI0037172066
MGVDARRHRQSDLEDMNRVIAAHKLRPLIDRVFPFEQALNAASYLASCAHFGKVVISH